jgi:hypothetical protein
MQMQHFPRPMSGVVWLGVIVFADENKIGHSFFVVVQVRCTVHASAAILLLLVVDAAVL